MPAEDKKCCNPCFVSKEVEATFGQTSSRFNERAAFAASAAQDDNTMMRMQFAAQAQQQLESTNTSRQADGLMQLAGALLAKPTVTGA